jgi:hypothetical protein
MHLWLLVLAYRTLCGLIEYGMMCIDILQGVFVERLACGCDVLLLLFVGCVQIGRELFLSVSDYR